MRSLWPPGCMRMDATHRAAGSARSSRAARSCNVCLWVALLLLAGCGVPPRVPLAGPGLRRIVAQGGQGALHFWWLPPSGQAPAARLLLWDGASVGVSDPAASNARFAPLKGGLNCGQVALAPDNHAFACGVIDAEGGSVQVQSLDDVEQPPQTLLDASAPLAWSPDSRRLAALRLDFDNTVATCSVVVADTGAPAADEDAAQALLEHIPFVALKGKSAGVCPVMALAWSPDGARLALALAASDGVVLEVLAMGLPGQPATIESRRLLPGKPLQTLDTPATPSLFWSPDGRTLAALTGYGGASEDGLFLLSIGDQTALIGPNLIDTGSGAALAWSPDGRWLAAGAVGPSSDGDNAQLRVFDTQSRRWAALASMFVDGPTLAWSADGSLLAAASAAQQGEVIWNWPASSLNSIIPNQNSANIEQLAWAQDGSALLFAVGAHSGGAPFYDEIYAQRFPVPPGVSSFAFPAWFLDALAVLPPALVGLGAALLALIALLLLLALIERGKSRRRRALIAWAQGVCAALFGLLLLGYRQLPEWLAGLYQPYSAHLCQGAPGPCDLGAALAMGTLGAPLLLALLVVFVGALLSSRERGHAEGLPTSVQRGPMRQQPAQPEPSPLLLPPPIDEQDTLELEIPPASVRTQGSPERDG